MSARGTTRRASRPSDLARKDRDMRAIWFVVAILVVSRAPCALADDPHPSGRAAPRRALTPNELALVSSTNQLAWDLLARLPGERVNTLYSPMSISATLAMLGAGARGETAHQIAAVLHVREFGPAVHATFADLLHEGDELA